MKAIILLTTLTVASIILTSCSLKQQQCERAKSCQPKCAEPPTPLKEGVYNLGAETRRSYIAVDQVIEHQWRVRTKKPAAKAVQSKATHTNQVKTQVVSKVNNGGKVTLSANTPPCASTSCTKKHFQKDKDDCAHDPYTPIYRHYRFCETK